MHISALQNSALGASPTDSARSTQKDGFQQALAQAMSGHTQTATGTGTGSAKIMTQADKVREAQAANAATLAEFREYMSKTPEQRMRDAILKEMGLSEEQLNALPAEEREAIEAAITAKIKERLLAQEQLKAEDLGSKMASNKNGLLQLLLG